MNRSPFRRSPPLTAPPMSSWSLSASPSISASPILYSSPVPSLPLILSIPTSLPPSISLCLCFLSASFLISSLSFSSLPLSHPLLCSSFIHSLKMSISEIETSIVANSVLNKNGEWLFGVMEIVWNVIPCKPVNARSMSLVYGKSCFTVLHGSFFQNAYFEHNSNDSWLTCFNPVLLHVLTVERYWYMTLNHIWLFFNIVCLTKTKTSGFLCSFLHFLFN